MLSIPIMEEILICLRKKNRITKQIAYEYYGKLMLLCIILLKTRLMHKKIHAKILDDEIKFFLIGGKGNFFSLPPERWRDRMNFDLLKEKIKEFKTSGDRIIKLLKNDIAKNEKSDSEIIKLI